MSDTDDPGLGDLVRDRVSGMDGIVTGIAYYLFTNPSVMVIPQLTKDCVPAPGTWIDMPRVEIVRRDAIAGLRARRVGFEGATEPAK